MSLPGKRRLVPQSPCQAAFCPGSGSARFRMRDPTAAAASRVAQEGLYGTGRAFSASIFSAFVGTATGSAVDGVRRGSSGMVIAFAGHASTQARHLVHSLHAACEKIGRASCRERVFATV